MCVCACVATQVQVPMGARVTRHLELKSQVAVSCQAWVGGKLGF